MKADSLNAKDLFEKNVRYVIPTFQRPYVWTKADQWEPLWEDVEHAAERYLEALVETDGAVAEAEERAGRHFLGAVVVKQQLTGSSEIETRDVIDGQQRLTTIQLLIDAAQEVAEQHGWDDVAEGLSDLVLNNKRYARRDADHIFKLWPTSTDRDAFRAAMRNSAETGPFRDSSIVKAHEYFKFRIADWVDRGDVDEEQEQRVHALETALLGLLELVVIDLGGSDDSFVIFETLNARGTPLLASDLVKNYLMQTAAGHGIAPEDMHGRYWVQFEEDDWWRKDVRQGRLTRPRLDLFLDYWLEIETQDDVASHQVFPTFKQLVETNQLSLSGVAGRLKSSGEAYREIAKIDPYLPEGVFMYRWRTVDAGASTPLLIWLFENLDGDDRLRCLHLIESFLVRRMVGRLTTKDYNKFFLEVLKRVSGASDPVASMETYLLEQESESRKWPTDYEFERSLVDLPLYRLLTRGRLRMVLEAIEDSLRGPKSEDEFVKRGKLTIEHLLPQSWRDHWPIHGVEDVTRAELERDRLLHTIGNLTLVTKSLNPALSNGPWLDKRSGLEDHTTLLMNKQLLGDAGSDWGEVQIVERSERLAQSAIQIWPRSVT